MPQILVYLISFRKIAILDFRTQININLLRVDDFNSPLSLTRRSSGCKINRQTSQLIDIIYQMHLTAIYRIFHSNTGEHTFYSAAQESFLRIEHILGQKPNLYKFKKNEITPCAVADYIAIKLKLTGKKKPNSSKYLVMAIKQLITQ